MRLDWCEKYNSVGNSEVVKQKRMQSSSRVCTLELATIPDVRQLKTKQLTLTAMAVAFVPHIFMVVFMLFS